MTLLSKVFKAEISTKAVLCMFLFNFCCACHIAKVREFGEKKGLEVGML